MPDSLKEIITQAWNKDIIAAKALTKDIIVAKNISVKMENHDPVYVQNVNNTVIEFMHGLTRQIKCPDCQYIRIVCGI